VWTMYPSIGTSESPTSMPPHRCTASLFQTFIRRESDTPSLVPLTTILSISVHVTFSLPALSAVCFRNANSRSERSAMHQRCEPVRESQPGCRDDHQSCIPLLYSIAIGNTTLLIGNRHNAVWRYLSYHIFRRLHTCLPCEPWCVSQRGPPVLDLWAEPCFPPQLPIVSPPGVASCVSFVVVSNHGLGKQREHLICSPWRVALSSVLLVVAIVVRRLYLNSRLRLPAWCAGSGSHARATAPYWFARLLHASCTANPTIHIKCLTKAR
jgi:hypothetical protein